jgi:NADP-dependent 3-hydroxy acid dehydrogenase YdfG
MKKKAIVISATSDIGFAICKRWEKNYSLVGTYKSKEDNFNLLSKMNIKLSYVDMLEKNSIKNFIATNKSKWDILVLCPATQKPVGKFEDINFDDWEESIILNLTSQLRILHGLLPYRNKNKIPTVILFAGGGTNNATINYSAYTIAKIASIKITELLDAEISNVKFIIYGPGWVKTKIHQATIDAKDMAGENYQKTIEKLNSNECTPMDDVIDSIEWGINCDKEIVGGRNISVVFDKWGDQRLEDALKNDINMYKLRRAGNEWT